ncbi:hypothetical protein [Gynuella sp.]|uniref:hypothetical protein n=1 Tax=Gynuella sp. TaxID=2969146 RepID=UPI003D09D239
MGAYHTLLSEAYDTYASRTEQKPERFLPCQICHRARALSPRRQAPSPLLTPGIGLMYGRAGKIQRRDFSTPKTYRRSRAQIFSALLAPTLWRAHLFWQAGRASFGWAVSCRTVLRTRFGLPPTALNLLGVESIPTGTLSMSEIRLSEVQSLALYRRNYLSAVDFAGQPLVLLDIHAFGLSDQSTDVATQVSSILAYVQRLLSVHEELELFELDRDAAKGLTVILNLCRTLLTLPGDLTPQAHR